MDCSALEAANLYERLNKDGSLWWVICGADFGSSKPVAHINYEGGTTMDDMVSKLSDDLIQYGCFKVLGVDNKGAITSTRMKFVCFQWVGSRVSKLKTAKAIPAKAEIFKYFQGHHLSLEIYDRGSLTEKDIEHRLRAAGGAHQPSDMQFPGGGHEVKVITLVPESSTGGGGEPSPAAGATSPTSSSSTTDAAPAAPPAPKAVSPTPAPAVSKFSAPSAAAAPAPGNPKAAAKLARAGEEASAASLAVGKAAARLDELIKAAEDGKVTVEALQTLVATELATAALKIAAASATVQEAK